MPVLGQGTWRMGERPREREREAAALTLGFDLGLTLFDTAEMYGEGGAEEVLAGVLAGRREQAYVVSKVYPHNASLKGTIAACERSLARLKTDRIDLYLLHWRGQHPLAQTVRAFEQLKADGKIGAWGVSNFDVDDMTELFGVPDGDRCSVKQVLYNAANRGIEFDLLPWCRRQKVVVMAYCPLDPGGRLLGSKAIRQVAARHDATAGQVALAWLLAQDGVVAIPKATQEAHVRANRAAVELKLTKTDLDAIDAAFPPPRGKQPLSIA